LLMDLELVTRLPLPCPITTTLRSRSRL